MDIRLYFWFQSAPNLSVYKEGFVTSIRVTPACNKELLKKSYQNHNNKHLSVYKKGMVKNQGLLGRESSEMPIKEQN